MSEVHGRCRSAVELTIRALQELGRLEPVDEAKVAIARALADAVDSDPLNASLWREYRAAEVVLRELNERDDDAFTALLQSLSAEVGDKAETGKTKSRKRNSGDR